MLQRAERAASDRDADRARPARCANARCAGAARPRRRGGRARARRTSGRPRRRPRPAESKNAGIVTAAISDLLEAARGSPRRSDGVQHAGALPAPWPTPGCRARRPRTAADRIRTTRRTRSSAASGRPSKRPDHRCAIRTTSPSSRHTRRPIGSLRRPAAAPHSKVQVRPCTRHSPLNRLSRTDAGDARLHRRARRRRWPRASAKTSGRRGRGPRTPRPVPASGRASSGGATSASSSRCARCRTTAAGASSASRCPPLAGRVLTRSAHRAGRRRARLR